MTTEATQNQRYEPTPHQVAEALRHSTERWRLAYEPFDLWEIQDTAGGDSMFSIVIGRTRYLVRVQEMETRS